MAKNKNFLSETAIWSAVSEFVAPDGKVCKAQGELCVVIDNNSIFHNSWTILLGTKLETNCTISKISENHYQYYAYKSESGNQKGSIDINQNRVFSKFIIENSDLNGYEVVAREGDVCMLNGALYDGEKLVNTWTTKMTKKKN